MPKFENKLIDAIKFWIYWIIVVTLTIGLFFALMENANFEGVIGHERISDDRE